VTYVDLGFARVDTDRKRRRGFPEVIYCEGKTPADVAAIAKTILEQDGVVLGTRATPQHFDAVVGKMPEARYHARGRCITIEKTPVPKNEGIIGVLCAGTSDLPVAEEAVITLEIFGNRVEKIFDVGVAGIHRLISERDRLEACNVLVVVAGMEGAPKRSGGSGQQAGHRRPHQYRLRCKFRRARSASWHAEQLRQRCNRGQH